MAQETITTAAAPAAIGPYAQAVRVGEWIWLSGQIPLVAATMELVDPAIDPQIEQVFDNIEAVARAAGGDLAGLVKLNIYLIDLSHFEAVNAIMERRIPPPYPARAVLGVSALPRGAQIEVEGVMLADPPAPTA